MKGFVEGKTFTKNVIYRPDFRDRSLAAMKTVRNQILQSRQALNAQGPDSRFSAVLDFIPLGTEGRPSQLTCITGDSTPHIDPHDWRTPGTQTVSESAQLTEFAEHIIAGRRGTSFDSISYKGLKIFVQDPFNDMPEDKCKPNSSPFYVDSPFPKANQHFLLFAQGAQKRPAIDLDETILLDLFSAAISIIKRRSVFGTTPSTTLFDYPARIVIHAGQDSNANPYAHMDIRIYSGLGAIPYLSPYEYGFTVNTDGTISDPLPEHMQFRGLNPIKDYQDANNVYERTQVTNGFLLSLSNRWRVQNYSI